MDTYTNPIKMEDNQPKIGDFDINGSGGIPLPPSLPYHKKLLLEGLARHEAFKDLRLTADFEPKFDELYTMLRGNPLFIEVMSIIALTHAKQYDFDFSGVALANDAEKYHNQWERVVKFVDPATLQGTDEGQNDAGEGEDVVSKDIFVRTLVSVMVPSMLALLFGQSCTICLACSPAHSCHARAPFHFSSLSVGGLWGKIEGTIRT